MYIQTIFALAALVFTMPDGTAPKVLTASLSVNVTNVEHRQGHVKAVLFNRSNFLSEKYVACIKIPAGQSQGMIQTVFEDLPAGDYAVAVYQDLNDNNWFDRNWIGYPKEPFAMSNNLRPFNLLYPDFEDAKVHLSEDKTVKLEIELLNN
jgi:uncharacterized protein (DUF2141 family)